MRVKVKITALVFGLLLAQGAVVWGQDQLKEQQAIMREYQINLSRIPKNLPPEQKIILEQRFKHQMLYERLKKHATRAQATSPHKENPKTP